MKSPFPGMDPYLESRWSDVHSTLVTYAREAINRVLPPGLMARTEVRAIVTDEGVDVRSIEPDVSVFERTKPPEPWNAEPSGVAIAELVCVSTRKRDIQQRFLEIRDARSDGRVVTVIECISPTNKPRENGRKKYRQKQAECRAAGINLVEVDLTRAGDRTSIMPIEQLQLRSRTTYLAWVSRASEPDKSWACCLPFSQCLPAIPIPLRPADQEILLELQPLIDTTYETGRYFDDIDYTEELVPPLSDEDAAWAATVLALTSVLGNGVTHMNHAALNPNSARCRLTV